jgi:RND family efflux transporter MFP subunit
MIVGDPPQPGVVVQAGRELFRLVPLSPEEDPIRREAHARARLEAARAGAKRAARLLEDQAGSQRRHEEAQAELAAAEATHRSLSAQLEGLRQSGLEPESAGGYTVSSPIGGRLVAVHVANNQTVAASAPLFEVAGDDPLWVRVPVYTGDVQALQADAPASLRTLGAAPDDVIAVERVKALPRADPDAVTVDLFYRLPNPGRRFHPGQRVSVLIGLAGAAEETIVIPHGAILHDAHAGTWVYENPSPNVYVRRRVEIERIANGLAVLARGPAVGTSVVVIGAPELFGAEFGVGH